MAGFAILKALEAYRPPRALPSQAGPQTRRSLWSGAGGPPRAPLPEAPPPITVNRPEIEEPDELKLQREIERRKALIGAEWEAREPEREYQKELKRQQDEEKEKSKGPRMKLSPRSKAALSPQPMGETTGYMRVSGPMPPDRSYADTGGGPAPAPAPAPGGEGRTFDPDIVQAYEAGELTYYQAMNEQQQRDAAREKLDTDLDKQEAEAAKKKAEEEKRYDELFSRYETAYPGASAERLRSLAADAVRRGMTKSEVSSEIEKQQTREEKLAKERAEEGKIKPLSAAQVDLEAMNVLGHLRKDPLDKAGIISQLLQDYQGGDPRAAQIFQRVIEMREGAPEKALKAKRTKAKLEEE